MISGLLIIVITSFVISARNIDDDNEKTAVINLNIAVISLSLMVVLLFIQSSREIKTIKSNDVFVNRTILKIVNPIEYTIETLKYLKFLGRPDEKDTIAIRVLDEENK